MGLPPSWHPQAGHARQRRGCYSFVVFNLKRTLGLAEWTRHRNARAVSGTGDAAAGVVAKVFVSCESYILVRKERINKYIKFPVAVGVLETQGREK